MEDWKVEKWKSRFILPLTKKMGCVIIEVTILQGDKKVIAYRQLYNITRTIGPKH